MTECRICLKVAYVQIMHLISDTWYQEMYEKLSGSKLSTENGRPDKICYSCNLQLENFHKFFEMSQESERNLNKRLSGAMEISQTTNDVPSINNFTVSSQPLSCVDNDNEVPEVMVTIKEEPIDYEFEELKEEYLESSSPTIDKLHTTTTTVDEETPNGYPHPGPMPPNTATWPPLPVEYPVHVKTENLETPETFTESILQNLGIALDISLKQSPGIKYSSNITGRRCRYYCNKCHYKSHTERALKLHSKVHDQTLAYACKFCSYRFISEKKLNVHSNYCTVCSICGKRFSNIHGLRIHVRLHTGVQPFSCDSCGRGFNQKTNLQTHMRVHSRDKQFPCQVCKKTFPFKTFLKRHMLIHEKGINVESLGRLINCHKVFARRKNKKCVCSICGRELQNRAGLKMHMNLHTGIKPFTCESCGRDFIQKCNLLTHIERLHSRDELFSCKLCHRIFPFNDEMKDHLLTHVKSISARDFEMFQQKHIYVIHSKLYNEQLMPYPCDMCKTRVMSY